MIFIFFQNLVRKRTDSLKEDNSFLHKHYFLGWVSSRIDLFPFLEDLHVHASSEIFLELVCPNEKRTVLEVFYLLGVL